MSDHILFGEVDELNSVDVPEDGLNLDQAGHLVVGEIDLSDIARDDRLGAEAQTGQEHLHLFDPGILGLVQDDEGVVERPAPHEGQGSHFDHILFDEPGGPFKVHHVMEGVVERAEVGVHLLGNIARQKTQLFTRFDGGPGQDDPFDLS